MSLTFSHFKKRKLEKVGDRTHFDAHRRVLVDEDKGAGLQSCFSDVILNQTMYTANLSPNTWSIWKAEAELDEVDCNISFSWNDNYRCLTCKGETSALTSPHTQEGSAGLCLVNQ
jgi:hypothetical protein